MKKELCQLLALRRKRLIRDCLLSAAVIMFIPFVSELLGGVNLLKFYVVVFGLNILETLLLPRSDEAEISALSKTLFGIAEAAAIIILIFAAMSIRQGFI